MDIMHKFELSKSLDYYGILLNSCVYLTFISVQFVITKVYGICVIKMFALLRFPSFLS